MGKKLLYILLTLLILTSSQSYAQRLTIRDLEEVKHAPYSESHVNLLNREWSIWNQQGDTVYYGHGLKSNKAKYWLTLIKNDRGWIDQVYYHFQRATYLDLQEEVDTSIAIPYRSEDHNDGVRTKYLDEDFVLTFWTPYNTKQLFYLHLEEIMDHHREDAAAVVEQ